MRKLLAVLLLLVVYPVVGQEYDYTLSTPAYTGLEYINQQQANSANLADDGVVGNINIGFEFEFYGETFNTVNLSSNGVISFKNIINGCCSGELLPSNQYNDFGIFGLWTDLVNIGTVNPYYKTLGEEGSKRFVVGWYDQAMFYDSTMLNSFEITLFQGSNDILLSYDDINLNRAFTSGIQGYGSLSQYEQIYHGTNGNELDFSSYLLSYSFTEKPEEPESPIAPDCSVNPNDTSCIINSVIDVEDTSVAVVDTQEQSFESTFNEQNTIEDMSGSTLENSYVDVQEGFVESVEESSTDMAEDMNQIADLVDQDTADRLADNIDSNVLDIVLSIVEQTSVAADSNSSTFTSTISSTSTIMSISSEDTNQMSSESSTSEDNQNNTDNGFGAAEELLATGVSLNNQSLDNLQQNINDSIEQSNEIDNNVVAQATESLEEFMLLADSNFQQIMTDSQDSYQSEQTETAIVDDTVTSDGGIEDIYITDVITFEPEQTYQNDQQNTFENDIQEFMPVVENIDSNDTFVEQEAIVDYTDPSQTSEEQILADIINNSTKTFQDEEQNDISEVIFEQMPSYSPTDNIMSGPMNVANLEILGVLRQNDDKSDAEKRAEEVVAANQEEQDRINSDYMNADQSGIVAAIGMDTDVNAYTNLILPDNNAWYRSEDIYKNIVIRDNVRGSYFLEKGNTDTYKRMVDEQYK